MYAKTVYSTQCTQYTVHSTSVCESYQGVLVDDRRPDKGAGEHACDDCGDDTGRFADALSDDKGHEGHDDSVPVCVCKDEEGRRDRDREIER